MLMFKFLARKYFEEIKEKLLVLWNVILSFFLEFQNLINVIKLVKQQMNSVRQRSFLSLCLPIRWVLHLQADSLNGLY